MDGSWVIIYTVLEVLYGAGLDIFSTKIKYLF